jgi:phospholipid/cholesterol/gamma-HCH transport system substrate-binding protein
MKRWVNFSAGVTLNGLEIGRVTQIVINESRKLLVELQIKSNFPISKSSVAAFTSLVLLPVYFY